jgi:thiamine-phosphate pyrophosphorylase
MHFRLPRLYAIIERSQLGGRPAPEIAESLLSAGVQLIQYRDKQGTSREIYEACSAIAERARSHHAIFIVNDRADIARAAGASGVHLGQDDLPVKLARRVLAPKQIIGVSTHNAKQVIEADRSTADYIAFGPIFETASKERPDALVGLEGLKEVRRLTKKPLVAIGGITLENARAVIEAGADSVAVIRALLDAPDVAERAGEFMRALA